MLEGALLAGGPNWTRTSNPRIMSYYLFGLKAASEAAWNRFASPFAATVQCGFQSVFQGKCYTLLLHTWAQS